MQNKNNKGNKANPANNTSTKPFVDVYDLITQRICTMLEQNLVPWRATWTLAGIPRNLLTKRPYSAINLLVLNAMGFEHNWFLTFKQLKTIGASVKKGEKAIPVVFTKMIEKEIEEDGETKVEKKPMLRYYNVFNIEQCKDIPTELLPTQQGVNNTELHNCTVIVDGMPNKPKIEHRRQDAFYVPGLDIINMPKMKSFKSSEDYYAILFHELIHSTGHSSRLNRDEVMKTDGYGKDKYAMEELVAELGACYLSSLCGLDVNDMSQNAAYIKGWLEVLKNDKRFLFKAATKAQKAVHYIINPINEIVEDEVPEAAALAV